MSVTRRSMMAAGVAVLALGPLAPLGLLPASPAAAQSYSAADLLAPGPLPDKVLGKASAPVTIIEYSSLTCSHCAHFHAEVYPKLKSAYIDTGKVRLILREYPLDPVAAAGSMLARCASDDKYFPLVDALFASQKGWAFTEDRYGGLLRIAKQAGFTKDRFDACLKDQKLLSDIEASRKRGSDVLGINSTPTFFINGEKHVGGMTFEELSKILDPLVR
ncbi:DsbA family protein [Blastochloris viridis]|uniref:Periplasmic thiol:disulfide interchange protein DsbA n=1 Tax=Blastochloris viridis TaxID=1079 RepID=A0A0H5BEU2_BLAVI|nr:DsbA family protein [Blastochloris viridis]ALK10444.1 Disulfide bond formation protein D precursor [Blastochloris viridis]BAR99614.1 periplasmic thiol:disulfide interchange protein DsbA [Blastochloris viridis]CUU43106.1 Thiol-disulfide oxidoreductase D [Blastochloris viridis]